MGKNLSFGGAKNFNKTVSNVKLNLKLNGTIPGLLQSFVWEIKMTSWKVFDNQRLNLLIFLNQ